MASSSKKMGCIGKCTSGLTVSEIDLITDDIDRTLVHPKGRTVFREYLSQAHLKTDLACLDLYQRAGEYIDKDRSYCLSTTSPSVEPLLADFNLALNAADDLDDVSDIDLALLRRCTEAADSQSRELMIEMLEEMKFSLMNHLRAAHKRFRIYAKEPCPNS